MESEKEVHQASEYMKNFFINLLEIKEFVRQKSEESQDPILTEIFHKLDKVIKERPNV